MQLLKKISRGLFVLLGVLLLFFLVLSITLQYPKIQTKTVQYITKNLSEKLGTEVNINSVDIDFFKTVQLKGITIKDLQNDTLLYADNLDATFGIFSIFNKQIILNQVSLDHASIKLKRPQSDSLFNYNFLIEAFASDDTTSSDPSWQFSIESIAVSDVNFEMIDEFGGTNLTTQLGELGVDISEMNLDNQRLNFANLKLDKTNVFFTQNTIEQQDDEATIADTTPEFPYFNWDLVFDKINITETNLRFIKKTSMPQNLQKGFDPNNIDIQNLSLSANNTTWTAVQLATSLKQLAFAEKSGFKLNSFSTEALLTPKELALKNLKIKTPKSQINNTTTVKFENFGNLKDNFENLRVNAIFSNTEIAYTDLKQLFGTKSEIPFLNTSVERFLNLSGRAYGSLKNMKLENIDLNISDAIDLKVNGTFQNITDLQQLQFEANLEELTTSHEKAMLVLKDIELPPGLKKFGTFSLTGRAVGKISDFEVEQLVLQTEANTGFDINGKIKGLPEVNELEMDLVIKDIFTKSEDIEGFVEKGLPKIFDSLGQVQYAGKFDGTLKKFQLDGKIQSDLGILESDIFMDFNEDYSSANYKGAIQLNDFQLGTLLGDSTKIGTVTLSGDLQGSGFVMDSLEMEAKLLIAKATYANYTYENISVDGFLKEQQFTGKFDLKDPNAMIDFNGKVSLNEERPEFRFSMIVDTINFQKLNLMEQQVGLHTKVDMNFTGNQLNDFEGSLNMTDIHLANDSISFQSDTLKIEAIGGSSSKRQLKIESDFINGNMEGDYDFNELYTLFLAYVNEYFPIENLLTPAQDTVKFQDVESPQNFSFFAELTNPDLIRIFEPKLQFLENARIESSFNSIEKTITIDGVLTKLMYDDVRFENVNLKTDGNAQKLNNLISITDLSSEAGVNISSIELSSQLFEQQMKLDLKVQNDTIDKLVDLQAVLNKPSDLYQLKLAPKMIFNNENWKVERENFIDFNLEKLLVDNLIFSSQNQKIGINSQGNTEKKSIPTIDINFDDFQLKEFSKILNIENVDLEGTLNGNVVVIDLADQMYYKGDLKIPDLVLNNEPVGQFSAKIEQPASSKKIDVEIDLKGENNTLNALGSYDVSTQNFDITSVFPNLELRLIDPLVAGIFGESHGFINGKFTLKGTPEKPDMNGFFNLREVSTLIDFTKTRYRIDKGRVNFDNSKIDIGTLLIKDSKEHTATISGEIDHYFFTNMILDLELSANNFTFLNTTADDNQVFYGKLYLDATATISGTIKNPLVEVNAKTLENSDLTISAFAEIDEFTEKSYIIFGNPDTYSKNQEREKSTIYEVENVFPAEVRLNLELTDVATFNFIVDPLTGDMLDCRGNSNLQINLFPSGDIELFGNYIISSGKYNFSYSDIVRRNFEITEGSNVIFVGDPLNSKLNVAAKYTTQATPYELINTESSLSDSEIVAAQRRQTTEVLLKMSGDLSNPVLSFDIELPESNGSVFSSEIQRKLNELRNDQNGLNTQVFGLLLFNSFIVSNASTDFSSTGETVLLGSVSKFISKQLNTIADKYIKGVQVNLDVSSYKSDYANEGSGAAVTEIDIGLTKNINDRLSVKAGGNFDVNADDQTSSFSQLAGDFVVEYKLTETGNYLVKVFRESDYDVLNSENTVKTGLGISWKKLFGGKNK